MEACNANFAKRCLMPQLFERAQHLLAQGNVEYGNTGEYGDRHYRKAGDRPWVFSLSERLYYFPCNECGEWLRGQRIITRCDECQAQKARERRAQYSQKYDRAEYHRKQRERLLAPINYHCIVCNSAFKAKRKTAKFCSGKCRQRHNRNPEKYQGKVAHPTWSAADESHLERLMDVHRKLCKQDDVGLDYRISYYTENIQPLLERKEYVQRHIALGRKRDKKG